MLGGETPADIIVAAHPVKGIARTAPAGEAEPRGLRLGKKIPRGAVAGRADDDHRVGEARSNEVGADIGRALLKGNQQVETARRGCGGEARAEERRVGEEWVSTRISR